MPEKMVLCLDLRLELGLEGGEGVLDAMMVDWEEDDEADEKCRVFERW